MFYQNNVIDTSNYYLHSVQHWSDRHWRQCQRNTSLSFGCNKSLHKPSQQPNNTHNGYDVETSYFTQLKMCYLMTTFRCPSDILITSWLFTARWSTWPGNHLVQCVTELVGWCTSVSSWSKVPLYPSGLSQCLSVDHFALSQSITWFSSTAWSVMADLWVTLLSLALR